MTRQYTIVSNMPREKNLEDIVNDVVSEHTSDLLAIQGRVGDKLVMEVMHRSKIKTDPKNIRRLILAKIA